MLLTRRSVSRLAISAGLALVLALAAAGTGRAAAPHVVSDLNHVTSVTSEPEAQRLYNALTGLGLPSAWPFATYDPISSGGVRLGNLNVELGAGTSPLAGNQFATFEPPTLNGLTAALDLRGIRHSPLLPLYNGGELLYTRVELPGYSQTGRFTAQFCAYNFPEGKPTRVAPANKAGLINVRRVVINSRNPGSWRKLMSPFRPSRGGTYRLPSGPLVQVEKARSDSVDSLELRVRSFARAARAFEDAGIRARGRTVSLGTLHLRLVASGS